MEKIPAAGLVLSIMMFGFFGIANAGIPFGEDDEFFVHMNILSSHEEDIDDATVRAYVYETGQYSRSPEFDVDKGSSTAQLIQFEISEPRTDYEPVRVVILNKDIREVRHIWAWME